MQVLPPLGAGGRSPRRLFSTGTAHFLAGEKMGGTAAKRQFTRYDNSAENPSRIDGNGTRITRKSNDPAALRRQHTPEVKKFTF